jgi:RimJ/RimL family protein N-acetyltransferase
MLLEVYGDREAMRYVGDGSPLTEAEARNWLAVTERNYRERGYGMFALLEKASGSLVGFCGIVHPGGQLEPEVKYALRRRYWGQGFATEAAAALMHYGVQVHGLSYIIATVAPEHRASQRVLAKIGMTQGTSRRDADGLETLVFEYRAPARCEGA